MRKKAEQKSENRLPLWVKIFGALAACACVALVGFIALLVVSLAGSRFYMAYIPVVTLAVAALCALLIFARRKGRVFALSAFVLLAAGLTAGGYELYDGYHRGIPTVAAKEVDLRDYLPFEPSAYAGTGSKVKLLDEPSTLSFGPGEALPRLDGATALYPVYSAFVRAAYPKGDYDPYGKSGGENASCVLCTTTSNAYERLIAGEADVIFAAAPSQNQLDAAKAAGVELVLTPIGREAFVFFVNAQNPVDGLATQEIRGVYSGEITNWRQVGGNNQKIRAFQRDKNSGSQSALERLMQGYTLMEAPTEDVASGMGGIITRVADYRNYADAIGFSFRFYLTAMNADTGIKLLAVDGVAPARQTIRDGSYPLSSCFYAVTLAEPSENTKRLIEWILSPQGQYLIEETGYVGVN